MNSRLYDIETGLRLVRVEFGEVGHWAEHPEWPDISSELKRIHELLEDTQREIRQAREARSHGP